VITIGDAISPATRERLARAGQPAGPDIDELVQAARAAASESTGPGASAWIAVALALAVGRSAGEARIILDEILQPGPLRDLAQSCLRALCSDDTSADEP
jgi:hypothetical protein